MIDPLDPTEELSSRPGALEVQAPSIVSDALKAWNIAATPGAYEPIDFGESANAFIRLSMFGACPFYDTAKAKLVPHDFTDPKKFTHSISHSQLCLLYRFSQQQNISLPLKST